MVLWLRGCFSAQGSSVRATREEPAPLHDASTQDITVVTTLQRADTSPPGRNFKAGPRLTLSPEPVMVKHHILPRSLSEQRRSQLATSMKALAQADDDQFTFLTSTAPNQRAAAAANLVQRCRRSGELTEQLRTPETLSALLWCISADKTALCQKSGLQLLQLLLGSSGKRQNTWQSHVWDQHVAGTQRTLIERCLSITQAGNPATCPSALQVLSRIVRLDRGAEAALQASVPQVVVGALNTSQASIATTGMMCLYYLGASADEQLNTKDALVAAGVLPYAVRLSAHKDKEVQEEAVQMLKLLSSSPSCCPAILEAGGLDALRKIKNSCTGTRQALAKSALDRLITHLTEANIEVPAEEPPAPEVQPAPVAAQEATNPPSSDPADTPVQLASEEAGKNLGADLAKDTVPASANLDTPKDDIRSAKLGDDKTVAAEQDAAGVAQSCIVTKAHPLAIPAAHVQQDVADTPSSASTVIYHSSSPSNSCISEPLAMPTNTVPHLPVSISIDVLSELAKQSPALAEQLKAAGLKPEHIKLQVQVPAGIKATPSTASTTRQASPAQPASPEQQTPRKARTPVPPPALATARPAAVALPLAAAAAAATAHKVSRRSLDAPQKLHRTSLEAAQKLPVKPLQAQPSVDMSECSGASLSWLPMPPPQPTLGTDHTATYVNPLSGADTYYAIAPTHPLPARVSPEELHVPMPTQPGPPSHSRTASHSSSRSASRSTSRKAVSPDPEADVQALRAQIQHEFRRVNSAQVSASDHAAYAHWLAQKDMQQRQQLALRDAELRRQLQKAQAVPARVCHTASHSRSHSQAYSAAAGAAHPTMTVNPLTTASHGRSNSDPHYQDPAMFAAPLYAVPSQEGMRLVAGWDLNQLYAGSASSGSQAAKRGWGSASLSTVQDWDEEVQEGPSSMEVVIGAPAYVPKSASHSSLSSLAAAPQVAQAPAPTVHAPPPAPIKWNQVPSLSLPRETSAFPVHEWLELPLSARDTTGQAARSSSGKRRTRHPAEQRVTA